MKFGEKVVKHRKIILIVAVLLLIPSAIGYLNTRINYDMLYYLPSDMETVKGQNLLLDEFGTGGFTLVVTENMTKQEADDMAKKYKEIEHVDKVLNLSDLISSDIPRSAYPKLVQENLDNENASMIVCFFDAATSDDASLQALQDIRKVSTKQCYASGMTALVEDLKNLCEVEEPRYVVVAVLLSLLAMMLLLDSYVAPILFLLSIGIAIVYNLGTNLFLGEVAYITKAIAAVLQLGVTMDYSIFVWHAYEENLETESSREAAMAKAVNDALIAVSGSSITTVAGFLALCAMSYTMGVNLGIVMAKGVILGVLASVTILPSLLLGCSGILEKTRHRSLIPDLSKFAHRLTSHSIIYIVIFAILFVPAIWGYQHENIIYDFTKMLSSEANEGVDKSAVQYKEANEKLEEYFHISSTHIIIADADMPGQNGVDMAKDLKKIDGIQNVLGLDAFVGPTVPKEALPKEVLSGLSSGKHQMILVNSSYKPSTDECNDQITDVKAVVEKYDPSAKVIGEACATKDLIELTANDFKRVNAITIALVFLIILFVLKSWTLPLILILTIEFAIYVNLGIPGFTHLELAFIVPVLVSTIQLGSTVDYAILMSTRYKVERMSGKAKREAVEIATAVSIPSILVSGLGFFTATFGVGIFSDIGIISTVCGLMARGALISMATVILVLPSMLMLFDKIICKTTKGLKEIGKTNEEQPVSGGVA